MKILPFAIFLLCCHCVSAQVNQQIDSLCLRVCEVLQENKNQVDSVRKEEAFKKHLYPFLAKFNREEMRDKFTEFFFRLQKHCTEFSDILDRANPAKGDWKIVSEMPRVRMKVSDCDEFFSRSRYKYLEHGGDTVRVAIESGYWIDSFKNGTFSKLKFRRTSPCTFEIEYEESDNLSRKNFSKPGDKYRYQLIEKSTSFYLLGVQSDRNDRIAIFKMYE